MNSLLTFTQTVTESTGERGEPVLTIRDVSDFDVRKIFDCGQCFRFDPVPGSAHLTEFGGVVGNRYITVARDRADELILHNVSRRDYDGFFRHYLALDTDYAALNERILTQAPSPLMRDAVGFGRGIRILRQDGWETLCSFILSQNNNIPRIKKMIRTLCETYGERFRDAFGEHAAFPSAEALASVPTEEFYRLRMGFRAKYLTDAARRWADGGIDPEAIACGTYSEGEAALTAIKGVGPKVAACALLFGFGHTEAFPVDVWIRRVLDIHFPDGFPTEALGNAAGIAQQYLFYYGRYSDLFK